MKLTVFGSGDVGLVTGAHLAGMGNPVCVLDVDRDEIEGLNAGDVDIEALRRYVA